jgi:hypothetical protein
MYFTEDSFLHVLILFIKPLQANNVDALFRDARHRHDGCVVSDGV